jgi:uncharacterized protein (TIGR03905 family)
MRTRHFYNPKGVCAVSIQYELDEDNRVYDICFTGGCPGNAAGISRLAQGRSAREIINILSGINCSGRGTSCPDQLAQALRAALGE